MLKSAVFKPAAFNAIVLGAALCCVHALRAQADSSAPAPSQQPASTQQPAPSPVPAQAPAQPNNTTAQSGNTTAQSGNTTAQSGNTTAQSGNNGQPQLNPDGTFTIRRTARLVVLDVVVTDKASNMIPGLTKDDFHVTELDHPQSILNFEETGRHAVPPPAEINSTADLDRIAPQAPVNILLLDEFNTRFEDMAFARYSLKKILEKQPDHLSTPTMLSAVNLQNFTGLVVANNFVNVPVDTENRVNNAVQQCVNGLCDARVTLYTVDPAGLSVTPVRGTVPRLRSTIRSAAITSSASWPWPPPAAPSMAVTMWTLRSAPASAMAPASTRSPTARIRAPSIQRNFA